MKKDVMTGPRKFGCDMCARGQRMLEYIEELEDENERLQGELSQEVSSRTEPSEGAGDTAESDNPSDT